MSRMLALITRHQLAKQHATLVANALADNTPTHTPHRQRSAPADPARLRGIPAIGRNVQGCIPGTRPDHARIDTRRPTR